ncbi:MAG: sugar ABC transporter substrate-binding protein [Thermomicrobiales bacterium]
MSRDLTRWHETSLRRALTRRRLLQTAGAVGVGVIAAPQRGHPVAAQGDMADYTSAAIDWKMADGKEIVLGALEHPWIAAVEPVLPQFTELTGITVNLQKSSETEYVTKLPVTLAGGSTTPDVFMVWSMGQAVEGGFLEPLDDYFANADLTDLAWYDEEDIFPGAREFPVWPADGKRYAVAITAEAQTLFMRKDLFEKAGLSAPETMDDLYNAATKLKSDGVAGMVMRAKSTADAVDWTAGGFIFSYGAEIIDEAGKAVFDSPDAIAAIDMYGKILRETGPAGIGNYHWMEALGDFMQGKAAIACDSSNFTLDLENPEKSTVVGNVLYGAVPGGNGNPGSPNMWFWLFGMNSKSANKDAAWLFTQWVTSKPTSLLVARNRAALPRKSAWMDPQFREQFGEQAAEAALANLAAANGAKFTRAWFNPKWPQVGDALAIAVNEVVVGSKDAQAALTEAATKANEELAS